MDLSLQRIKEASAGLLYLSESDYPFEPIALDGTSLDLKTKLLELSGKPYGTKVDVVTLEQFFRNITLLPSGSSPEQAHMIQRFITLQHVLQEELSDIAIYLIGEVEIDASIIGRLGKGTFAGLRTKIIQT